MCRVAKTRRALSFHGSTAFHSQVTTTHITGAGQRARQPAVRLNRRLKSPIDRSPRASWSQRGSWGRGRRVTADRSRPTVARWRCAARDGWWRAVLCAPTTVAKKGGSPQTTDPRTGNGHIFSISLEERRKGSSHVHSSSTLTLAPHSRPCAHCCSHHTPCTYRKCDNFHSNLTRLLCALRRWPRRWQLRR